MAISFNNQNCSSNKSISSVRIDEDGNLVVVYSDSTSEVIGKVQGKDGKDFAPDMIGELIPDGTMFADKPLGFVYESLANGKSVLYFKSSDVNVTPVTWSIAEYGKGDKGDSFNIDSEGTTLPDLTDLPVGYTFYNTANGTIYIKTASLVWGGPYQWKGDKGAQGQFIINSEGTTLPDSTTLYEGYTFFNTTDGKLYYVYKDGSTGALVWSVGSDFRGPQGLKGDIGPVGNDAEYVIKNTVDFSLANTLIVIGTVPKGYVITKIDANVETALNTNVVEMEIRFGGTAQSETGSVIIADQDLFDINVKNRYIVDEINHDPSTNDEIVSAVFDYAPLNSDSGILVIRITIGKQLPIEPIVI